MSKELEQKLEYEMAEMLEIIEKAREIYTNDITDRTENEYIREGLLNAGYHKQSEWISVDERLPEENVRVLVCIKSDHSYTMIDTDRLDDKGFVRWYKDVTHWMPLPEAPKMKGGAEMMGRYDFASVVDDVFKEYKSVEDMVARYVQMKKDLDDLFRQNIAVKGGE